MPLSWPPKQVSGRFMEQVYRNMSQYYSLILNFLITFDLLIQDPRLTMGGMGGMPLMSAMSGMGMTPGGFPSAPASGNAGFVPGAQPMSGFLDPNTLQDMREAMANIKLTSDPR